MKQGMKYINKPRFFVSVYDGYTRMTRCVDRGFKDTLRAFADEYRGGDATNGAMMKLLDDMNGQRVSNNAQDLAETTGYGFAYSATLSWTPADAAGGGPRMTIATHGDHGTIYKTMTMDELCNMVDHMDDNTRMSDILPDTSEADIENAKTTYMGYFEGIENMQSDLQDYDNKFESIFEDTFKNFYPLSVGEVRCTIEDEFKKSRERGIVDDDGRKRNNNDDGQRVYEKSLPDCSFVEPSFDKTKDDDFEY